MNSLHDYLGGWDKVDPAKAHHPLSTGEIKVEDAIRVVHWGLPALMACGVFLTVMVSPDPVWALVGLCLWYAWGMAYNLGLSKVSALGFLPISICFTAMGAWAWLLSHQELGYPGGLWLGYVFFTILFQISYSGFLKELEVKERSNILVKLGARVDVTWRGEKVFRPGYAWVYGWTVKGLNFQFGYLLLLYLFEFWRVIWFGAFAVLVFLFLFRLTQPRDYDRSEELLSMSLEEIATIYLPLFMLNPLEALILAGFGVAYFFLFNRLLWRTAYPKV